MRKLALMVGMGLLLAPVSLAAQVCLGSPGTRGQSNLGGVIRLQSNISQFGGTYSGDYPSAVVADGLLTYDHYSVAGTSYGGFTAGARLGLELHSVVLPASLSLCPHAGLSLSHYSGHNLLTIPVGIGIGTVIPLDNGSRYRSVSRLAPPASGNGLLIFATPAVAYEHFAGHSDTYVLSEIGARYLVARFYVGASVFVKSGGRNTVLGLNAGIPLP